MAEKNGRKTRLPVFIFDILKTYSGREHHLTQESIRLKLKELYNLEPDRRAVSRDVNALLDEEFYIFGNSRTGYWYDRYGYAAGQKEL